METAVWGYRTPWGKPSPEDVNDLDGAELCGKRSLKMDWVIPWWPSG